MGFLIPVRNYLTTLNSTQQYGTYDRTHILPTQKYKHKLHLKHESNKRSTKKKGSKSNMVSGTHRSQSTVYKQIRNRKEPTTDYEASSRNSAITEYNDRGDIEIIKVGDVAELLQVSTWMVYELVKSGELPHFKVGRSVRFIKGEVVRWALR